MRDKWFSWEVIPGDTGGETGKEAIKGCVDEPVTSHGQWGPLGTAEPSRGAQPEDEELRCLFITSKLLMGGAACRGWPPALTPLACDNSVLGWGGFAGTSVGSQGSV